MTDKCGDDLIAARRFTNLCQTHMSEIFSGGQLPMHDVVTRLSEIQSHAKLMHARSIYRSAQAIIDELTVRRSAHACTASVLVLQKLIRQYETGLSEIAPVVRQVIKRPKENHAGPDIVAELNQQKSAARTLTPLIKFAQGKDRESLVSLVKYVANKSVSTSSTPAQEQAQKVDSILPNLTNHWLRLARSQEKSISVSSALDDLLINSCRLGTLQKGLMQFGEILIRQTVETPRLRAAKSLSRSAHLAITGRKTDDKFSILLSCEGDAPKTIDFEAISKSLLRIDIQSQLKNEGGLVRIELTGPVRKSKKNGGSHKSILEAVL